VSEVEVIVCKGGREIDRVRRPLRHSAQGLAVTYRRKLWPLRNGIVNLDEAPACPDGESDSRGSPPSSGGGPDPVQNSIINRPPSDRVLVDAGPGTGKTRVACARVAALIIRGIPPSRIWLVSFTRTAVVEVRNRIASALGDAADAAAVSIATLDSHAWSLQSGFNSDARLSGSFDENIEATLKRLQEDSDLRDYLATRVKHLIIDEGQDIVGIRAELTMGLIHAVGEDCGVTVFADEAQAIYGFSEDAESGTPGAALIDQLRSQGFEEATLGTVHRTSRSSLRKIFTGLRKKVLSRSGPARHRRAEIEAEIRANADEADGSLTRVELGRVPENGLVLARRRIDVLLYSSMQAAIPHRLRLSGLPAGLKPWIGHLLWDRTDPRLTQTQFGDLWSERSASAQPGSPDQEAAWRLMVEVAGRSSSIVDLSRLREVLGRSSPPMLFCAPEFGYRGPILGTIHASKGREADFVALYLPRTGEVRDSDEPEASAEEEIRVLFVGATRAREYLRVGDAPGVAASSINGRVWRRIASSGRAQRVQIEVGRLHDVTPEGLVGRRTFACAEDAESAQIFWRNSPVQQTLCARAERELDWGLVLEDAERHRLAALGQQLQSDLRELARLTGTWPPPGFIPHLRSLGARTLAVAPADPRLELLHDPWRSSGFLSAPLLIGFSTCTLGEKAWS
jgi:hypothetical protein